MIDLHSVLKLQSAMRDRVAAFIRLACHLGIAIALLIAPTQPTQAFGGNDSAAIDLPATGGLFQCRLTARAITASGPFDVSTEYRIRVGIGLDFVTSVSAVLGSDEVTLDLSASESQFQNICNVENVQISINTDLSLDETADNLRNASLLEMKIRYRGQDGEFYRANAALRGQSNTQASASVVSINGDPDITLLSQGSVIANNGTIDIGTVERGRVQSFVLDARNDGILGLTRGTPSLSNESNFDFESIAFRNRTLAGGESDLAARVEFRAPNTGPFSFRINVPNNDPDENPATVTVRGVAVVTPPSGLSIVQAVPSPTTVDAARPFRFRSDRPGTFSAGPECDISPSSGTAIAGVNQVDVRGPVSIGPAVPPGTERTVTGCRITFRSSTGDFSDDLTIPDFVIDNRQPLFQRTDGIPDVARRELITRIFFSEPVRDFQAEDIIASGATVTLPVPSTGFRDVHLISVEPIRDGEVTLQLRPNSVFDEAGNGNPTASIASFVFDVSDPDVTLSGNPATAAGPFNITIDFSEPVFGFQASDVSVTNGRFVTTFETIAVGTPGALAAVNGRVIPDADGEVTVIVPANSVEDLLDNPNPASNQISTMVDLSAPSVSISALTGPANGVQTATIILSEPSNDFTVEDLTLVNATATLAGSGTDYTVTLTPLADGAVSVAVLEGVFTDAAGNPNTASDTIERNIDLSPPFVAIAPFTGPANGVQTAEMTLSEPSDDFTVEDLTLVNATATLTGSGVDYVATLTPLADGPLSLTITSGVFTDAAGNLNTASNVVDGSVDLIAPSVTIAPLAGPANGVQTAAITLSEPSSDFALEDLTLVNATATLTGSGADYTATLTPVADGLVSLSVAEGVFSDAAGNLNTASGEVTVQVDVSRPTVALETETTEITSRPDLIVTVTFSEEVTGLTAEDFILSNATLVTLTGSGAFYSVALTAANGGDVTISLPADAVADLRGNPNVASETLSIRNVTVEVTQRLIAQFMQSRTNQLLTNQPQLRSFLSGDPESGLGFDIGEVAGLLQFAANDVASENFWVRLSSSWSSEGDSEAQYALGTLGVHSEVSENALIGLMLQLDDIEQTEGGATVEGSGWLIGPYIVARAPDHPLFVEGRLLYGGSANDVSPFGTYTDSFDTERLLAQIEVSGAVNRGRTTWRPAVRASYAREDQESYVDALGNPIPSQRVGLGQAALGFDVETRPLLDILEGDLMLRGGFEAIQSFTDNSGFAQSIDPAFNGARGRLDLGVGYSFTGDAAVAVDAFYDGIGAGAFEGYGVGVGFEMRF
ncbi:hypothetical protein I0K15_10110 [Pontivivens ytuae]|uniref:Autotransporter domain-containing protein n=2 Tax=Pontivivens ytuae TaxID=2789856 RepID=A0A7S9QE79_9RHOB|nr:hypothetical protein I0K15_10110 [Pontivivens ytuae]